MGQQFADLPRWEFSVVENKPGEYNVIAVRDGGIRGEASGVDPDYAMSGLRDWAT